MSIHPSDNTPGGDSDLDEPESPATLADGLVSIRSIFRDVRRRRRLWLTFAVLGLAVGLALPKVMPLKYSATALLYLSHNPTADQTDAMANDVVLLQTEEVAAQTVSRLHSRETARQFLAQYDGTSLSDELLQITATAPSQSEAVRNANAVAAAFLTVRTRQFEQQSAATQSSLYALTAPLQKQVTILKNEIGVAKANGGNSSALTTLLDSDVNQLATISQTLQQNAATLATVISGSSVLQPGEPSTRSHLKTLLKDGVVGLIAGLVLGLGIVAVSSVTSDRLRRRDEIAAALGTPVELSVQRFKNRRWLRPYRLRRKLRHPDADVLLAARYLRAKLPPGHARAVLGVVAIDSVEPAAVFVAHLAARLATEGTRVGIADLSRGAGLARLVRARGYGASTAKITGTASPIAVLVPPDDLSFGSKQVEPPGGLPLNSLFGEGTDKMPASVEVVLVLATLDPALGAAQLASWAEDVVVVVTVGRSTAHRLWTNAEMIRSAGCRLDSALLVGADNNDDSLGRFDQEQWVIGPEQFPEVPTVYAPSAPLS